MGESKKKCISSSNILVTTVIGFLSNEGCNDNDLSELAVSDFQPNEGEIAEVFTLPITHLLDKNNQGYKTITINNDEEKKLSGASSSKFRLKTFNVHEESKLIWGLTAYILDEVLKDIIVPSLKEKSI
eukprot:TRINITY_DN5340_c0_g1_i1.p1 TRINITY_DN5340_c0_g1~~TRINITY_DN5340_c0_g1_i1.p1  ORF type:complete len:128 (+),score=29.13 TRINITY_DN5340_c0_g1_i1:503-886(+)